MKFELLGPYRMKILMSPSDMEEWSLFSEEEKSYEERNRQIFKKFLRYINVQTGFDAEKSNVLMEAFPKKGGEMSIMITKVDNSSEFRILKNLLGYESDERPCFTYNAATIEQIFSVLAFDSLEDFFLLCSAKREEDGVIDSSLILYEEKYYLLVFFEDPIHKKHLEIVFSDYARILPPTFATRLHEYGKVLMREEAMSYFSNYV